MPGALADVAMAGAAWSGALVLVGVAPLVVDRAESMERPSAAVAVAAVGGLVLLLAGVGAAAAGSMLGGVL